MTVTIAIGPMSATMTLKQWQDSIASSEPCPKCGCRLLELTEDGPMCAGCCEPYSLPNPE